MLSFDSQRVYSAQNDPFFNIFPSSSENLSMFHSWKKRFKECSMPQHSGQSTANTESKKTYLAVFLFFFLLFFSLIQIYIWRWFQVLKPNGYEWYDRHYFFSWGHGERPEVWFAWVGGCAQTHTTIICKGAGCVDLYVSPSGGDDKIQTFRW